MSVYVYDFLNQQLVFLIWLKRLGNKSMFFHLQNNYICK